MGFTGLDFYRSACRVMRQRFGTEPAYFVFSDDVKWCVQNLDWLGPRTVFVGHEYAGEHFGHYLQLMSLCPNFIIPNSTFGWWAAWLSKAPDKKVIAPTRWFVDPNVGTTDLCPPSWERL